MAGGTEAFPDLGRHCQHPDCHQLDFLPFKCDGCRLVFCLEHRNYKSHDCPKSDLNSRKVIICNICSSSIETTGNSKEDEKAILERHERSGDCDPSKNRKPKCPVKRCKQILTFSNTNTCKICNQKVCLKHRFPADHACKQAASFLAAAHSGGSPPNPFNKFLVALSERKNHGCGRNSNSKGYSDNPVRSSSSVKAC